MPKAKDIGLGKHLDEWEKRKRQEQKRKDEIKRHKEQALLYGAKTKELKAKKRLQKARGKSFLGGHRPKRRAGRGGWV